MIYTLISFLLCLFIVPIVLKRFGFLNLHNLYLLYLCLLFTYIAILLTFLLLHVYSPNASNLFYLFNFDSIFSMLHLPIEEEVKSVVQAPITNDLSEHLILLNKNLNVLIQNVQLLLDKQMLNNNMLETLLQQNQIMHNNSVEKLTLVVQNTANLKSSISGLQSVCDIGFKNLNATLNGQTSTLSTQTKEILLNLASLNEHSPKILQSLNSMRDLQISNVFSQKEMVSILYGQNELTMQIADSTLKALDAKSMTINELNEKYEILKQTQEENHLQSLENAKHMQADIRKNQVETSVIKSDVNALKPKEYETKTSWSSQIPFISDYFNFGSNKK